MKTSTRRLGWALLAMAALLSACGGGGGDVECCIATPSTPGNGGSQLPSSATASSDGLVAYLKDLIASHTDATSEPVVLGNVSLPTSETSEPLALN